MICMPLAYNARDPDNPSSQYVLMSLWIKTAVRITTHSPMNAADGWITIVESVPMHGSL